MEPTRVILLEDFQPMHISDRVVTQEDHKDGLFLLITGRMCSQVQSQWGILIHWGIFISRPRKSFRWFMRSGLNSCWRPNGIFHHLDMVINGTSSPLTPAFWAHLRRSVLFLGRLRSSVKEGKNLEKQLSLKWRNFVAKQVCLKDKETGNERLDVISD